MLWMLVDAVEGCAVPKGPALGRGTFWDMSTRAGLSSQERELGIANKMESLLRRLKQLETKQARHGLVERATVLASIRTHSLLLCPSVATQSV